MWEQRFGFPEPTRLPSGHRRYRDARRGRRPRGAGSPARAGCAWTAPSTPSAPCGMPTSPRCSPPSGPPTRACRGSDCASPRWSRSRTRSRTRCAPGATRASPSAPSSASLLRPGRARWRDIARRSRSRWRSPTSRRSPAASGRGPHPVLVPLAGGDPMRGEWAVVCDSPAFAAVLSAWEPPGQPRHPDSEREFEAVWTLDPGRCGRRPAPASTSPRPRASTAYPTCAPRSPPHRRPPRPRRRRSPTSATG